MKKKNLLLAIPAIVLSLVVGSFFSNVVAAEEDQIVVNDKNFNPSTNNPPVTSINWQKNQESGFDGAFTASQSSALGDGSADHIQLINNEIKFFGYKYDPYLDYLYYPESDAGEKEFKFNISQDKMDWHTINSVGFFVNCIKNTDGTYSGYFFSLERGSIALRKMDHYDLSAKHVNGGEDIVKCPVVFSEQISTGSNDVYDVSLKSENTKFSIEVNRTASSSVVSTINFDLDLATATSAQVPNGYVGGNDFGIYSAYDLHACSSLSYATFSNIAILSNTTRSKGNVNVEFLDYSTINGSNKSVKDAITASGYEGQGFSVQPPAIENYVYVGSSLDSNAGTYVKTPQKVQLYYVQPKYTVEHVDENGKVLATETFDKGLSLKEYTAESKTFDGYTVSGKRKQSVTLTKDSPNQKIVFTYKAVKASPATGDTTNIATLYGLLSLSMLGLLVVKKTRKIKE